ncbi:hypothetical protein ACQKP0_11635 [Heyndrickxia sp. NPDC080065]|uniref:hypothetical protein n=1 Tax=Heyndrickxia sp. NPDC080065 TaxID=3390568 RepID=UPI003CFEB2F4
MSDDIQIENTEEIMDNEVENKAVETKKTDSNDDVTVHPFDRMFFGGQRRRPIQEREKKEDEVNQPSELDLLFPGLSNHPVLKDINLDEMMNHFENLFVSFNELKPMFQKVSPLITKYLKKEK